MPLDAASLIVIVNAALVAVALIAGGWWLARCTLSPTEPCARQNVGEAVLGFFLGKARDMASGPHRDRILRLVTPMLATFFLFIVVSNLVAILPLPILNRPPTSHFSATLALALCSVLGTLLVSAAVHGAGKTLLHLVWPNPLQWVSEVTDVMSLSLRLFGNIAGEFMTVALVLAVVPWGIPLILHAVGLIPAFVQALVFTLLTASFLANSLDEAHAKVPAEADHQARAPASIAPENVSTLTAAEGR
jgi:F-type H+-transporting ATPase subunit a